MALPQQPLGLAWVRFALALAAASSAAGLSPQDCYVGGRSASGRVGACPSPCAQTMGRPAAVLF
jgi:hypothetical protein